MNSSTTWKMVKKFQETGNALERPGRERKRSVRSLQLLKTPRGKAATKPSPKLGNLFSLILLFYHRFRSLPAILAVILLFLCFYRSSSSYFPFIHHISASIHTTLTFIYSLYLCDLKLGYTSQVNSSAIKGLIIFKFDKIYLYSLHTCTIPLLSLPFLHLLLPP